VLKDRLYCDAAGGARRRSAQTVMHRMLRDIALLLSPVLPFTSDEIWPLVPGAAESSVHLALFPRSERPDDAVRERWSTLLEVRGAVTKALEEARAAKLCAASLEARVTVKAPPPTLAALRRHEDASRVFPGNLANLFIVSRVDLEEAQGLSVEVARAAGAKCERCWTFSEGVGRLPVHPAVCERCASVLETA
jgi:isoleucyl-tRNA synthetase